jgi:hypothetical protein
MSLQARIETFAQRVKEEFDATNARIGNLALLTTANKQSIVGSINEIRATQTSGVNISADPGNAITTGSDGGIYCQAAIVSTLHW